MSNSKFYVDLNASERSLLLTSLNDLRNDLLSKGKYTDAVDELMCKIAKAKQRTFIIKYGGLLGHSETGAILRKALHQQEGTCQYDRELHPLLQLQACAAGARCPHPDGEAQSVLSGIKNRKFRMDALAAFRNLRLPQRRSAVNFSLIISLST